MTRGPMAAALAAFALCFGSPVRAEPSFVNGLVLDGAQLDDTEEPGANKGRLGFFSDIYYDPKRKQWWALSDRGPGGGVISYATRVQRIKLDVDRRTGRISKFKVLETVVFSDPEGLLAAPAAPGGADPEALNGLNPALLNGSAALLGRSFDPEGLVVNPRNGNLIVSDEYGPAIYEFNRDGELVKVFETPANLVPRLRDGTGNPAGIDYVAGRGDTGVFFGRQDNRGFEGLAVAPDGSKLYAVLQDPLMNEPGPNDGRNGRNVRIVVFDNDAESPTYGKSIAQYAYQLEPQADVAARINAQITGNATTTDPRQGRNIGLSAITAINDRQFLVLERDNRGIGVDDPRGANAVGSKRVYKIDISGATDISTRTLPGGSLPADITAVSKSPVFIDLARNTVLPNGKLAEKWEGLAIGPELRDGSYLILAGTDNDYSVTQNSSNIQFDVYVDFKGNSVQRDIDQPTRQNGVEVGPVPAGYVLVPGVLHAYKVSAGDLGGYVPPRRKHGSR